MIMSFRFDFSAQSLDRKDNVQESHNKYNNSLCMCTVYVLLSSINLNIVKICYFLDKTKRFISFYIYTHAPYVFLLLTRIRIRAGFKT